VHAFDPHAPYARHPEHDDKLPLKEAPPVGPPGWQREQLSALGPPPPEDDPEWRRALRGIRNQRGAYDQEVRHTDEQVGRLLTRLESLGVGENLIVAVVSDHGEGLWEQLSRQSPEKLRTSEPSTFFFQAHGQDLSEQALFTPFLLSGPGLPRGTRIEAAVENLDLFPTLLHLVDLPAPGRLDGRDLSPLLRAEPHSQPWREESHAFVIRLVAVRDELEGSKLVVPVGELDTGREGAREGGRTTGAELYRLDQDPFEHDDRSAQEPQEVARLEGRARAFLAQYPTRKSSPDEIDEELRERMGQLGYAHDLLGEEE
jgi:arylsulfatase A-like enzyme